MFSRSELRKTALASGYLYIDMLVRGQSVLLPRTTLPIYTAVRAGFPDHLKEVKSKEMLRAIETISPVLIITNDYCDLGLATRRRIDRPTSPRQLRGLVYLERRLRQNLDKQIAAIPSSHVRSLAQSFVADLITLTAAIPDIQHKDHRDFVELDSAIFEAAALSVSVPQAISAIGINLEQPTYSFEDLKNKYRFYLGSTAQNADQATVLAFHAVEMILKIVDDAIGYRIDALLGIPNLNHYAEWNHIDLRAVRSIYRQLALRLGFPPTSLKHIEYLFALTHRWKVKQAEKTQHLFQDQYNTNLREELYVSGALAELFA